MDLSLLETVVRGLMSLPKENDYVEFKMNEADPIDLGERISGLSNAAALAHRPFAYLIWGVDDKTKELKGTNLSFATWKKGNEDIVPYWRISLVPHIEIFDYELEIDGKHVLVLEISAASYSPTLFRGVAYCRVDSYTKPIKDFPASQKRLFEILNDNTAEKRICLRGTNPNEIDNLLDLDSYFKQLNRVPPHDLIEKIRYFVREGFLVESYSGTFDVTYLGALLYAKDLTKFETLEAKAVRVVYYEGNNRLQTKGRDIFNEGYALCFDKINEILLAHLANPDTFHNGIREDSYSIPPIAVREALANALMHQDLLSGYGPLVEVFDNRVEWSNSGELHVEINRIIDMVPMAENPKMALFLRRINIGDTSGSGVDKICLSLEKEKAAPPSFETSPTGTRLIIFRNKHFADMDQEEKVQAIYYHVVLKHIEREDATNASIRNRFGLGEEAIYVVTRLLAAAVSKGLIKKKEVSGKKDSAYLPYWA